MFEAGCDIEYETETVKLPHIAAECEKSFTLEAELPPSAPVFTAILDSAAYCSRGEAERGEAQFAGVRFRAAARGARSLAERQANSAGFTVNGDRRSGYFGGFIIDLP